MPRRTRRTDAPAAAHAPGAPDAAAEAPKSAEVSAPPADAVRPRSPRSPRPRPVLLDDPLAEAPNPVHAESQAKPVKQTSRRGRKPAASSDAVAPPPAVPTPADPAAEPGLRSSRRRHVGGRRTVADALLAQEPAILAEHATPEAPEGAAPRSTRRRRGGKRGAAQTETAAEAGAPEVQVSADAQPTEEEGRHSRRPRRSGRRRGRAQEASEGEDVTAEVAAEPDEPLTLPQYTPPPVWIAPRLVPAPGELDLAPVALGVTAALDSPAGRFVIDGKPHEPRLLFINAEAAEDAGVVQDQIRSAAAAGIHLHSGFVYLPLKNAYGDRSYAALDALLSQILTADPEGYILLRLQCVPTNFWARTHPLEMMRYADGSEGDVSFASTAFWRDCVEGIAALLAHLAGPSTPGGSRVVGLHLDKGEWFNDPQSGYDYSAPNRQGFRNWLHAKYQSIYALRASWFDNTVSFENAEVPANETPDSARKFDTPLSLSQRKRRWVDYNIYASETIADAIKQMAEAIKTLSLNRLLVAVSYGYTFEFAQRSSSGHQALGKLLVSDAIDVVAGPNSYQNRAAGGPGAFSSPVDSVRLHGKLYMLEDDTKTYLATEETEDTYNPLIATEQDTSAVHLRNAGAGLMHHCGICWMDLWGKGWLHSEPIWTELSQIGDLLAILNKFRAAGKGHPPAPEVAVVVDEASCAYIRSDPSGAALQAGLIVKARDLLCRSGASLGFYLQSDIARLPEGVKLVIFLNALQVTMGERQAVRELLQRPGKTLAWLYAPGLFDEKGASAQEVSEIVGMPLKAQPWNSRVGTLFTEERHAIIERLHGGKRMGTEEIVNPSYTVTDPQAKVLGEYLQTGNPSISAKSLEAGWKSVFIGEPHLTGELIRGIYRYAGVHMYDVQDDVVSADDDGLLMVHAPYSGQRTIHLPRAAAVYHVGERRLMTQQASTFRAFMRARTTHVFIWGDLERIAAATGLSVDELKETHIAQREPAGEGRQRTEPVDRRSRRVPQDELEMVLHQIDEEREEHAQDEVHGAELYEETVMITEEVAGVSSEDGAGAPDEPAGLAPEPSTPSRRRRWQRRQSSSASRPPAAPLSLEEILPDLPPRRRPSDGSSE